ncbi:GIY-YIG nuclease family protein [Candidatus Daviesbacteria bacterium]|nr:GIY-YIG nuclease family protein [Candidatus Daviesbacteria bacterium]
MSSKWRWYVYILELLNGRYYTGMTWNPITRFEQHLSKLGSKYTARYGIKRLVYLEEHEDINEARHREIQIKDFSQKKKRELIRNFLATLEK